MTAVLRGGEMRCEQPRDPPSLQGWIIATTPVVATFATRREPGRCCIGVWTFVGADRVLNVAQW